MLILHVHDVGIFIGELLLQCGQFLGMFGIYDIEIALLKLEFVVLALNFGEKAALQLLY